jgi:hypothetical protein
VSGRFPTGKRLSHFEALAKRWQRLVGKVRGRIVLLLCLFSNSRMSFLWLFTRACSGDRTACPAPQPLNSGFVIELLPTAVDGRYDLAAYRAVFALQASWFARSILDRAIRSKSCEWKSVLYQNVNLLAFAACVLCGAGTSCCGAVALARYRRPPWAFPP